VVQPPAPWTLLQSVSPPRLAPSRWPPLLGFASPPSRHLLTRVHSHPILGPGFGHRLPHRQSRSALVVSHHLDGFLREQAVSLLHLTTSQRFTAFHPPRPPRPVPEHRPGRAMVTPRSATTPLEEYPSSAAVPCHHGRCPPGVAARPTRPGNSEEPPLGSATVASSKEPTLQRGRRSSEESWPT
jgi:hypothetical protein